MDSIRIRSARTQNVTVIPNEFLDRFLPLANGDFLKIYLYLLRYAEQDHTAFSISDIADCMNCTENDVQRALRYWGKEQVLELGFDEEGSISEIAFAGSSAPEPPKKNTAETAVEKSSQITGERMTELGENEEVRELLFVAQQYIGRPLTRSEMQKICFFYDSLSFSADLIDYLIEYCISRGKTSFHYMEKVAVSWKEQGISTVHEARMAVGNYHKEYYDILKALGINNHHPVETEIRLMKKWLEKYAFSMDIIEEACSRTLMTAGKPTLGYADGILSRWNQNGVKTMDDVRRLDQEHRKNAAAAPKRAGKPSNSFSDFEQRSYDYSDLEARLSGAN
ncbi:MAG: DnaD domain protein [Lachnospiraceae bacterium]|nr:DnaD domain protein [Lachnospiraceae bacterium]